MSSSRPSMIYFSKSSYICCCFWLPKTWIFCFFYG